MKSLVAALLLLFSSPTFAQKMFLDDPETLRELETRGFDFARWVMGETTAVPSNGKLEGNPLYRGLVSVIGADLTAAKAKDSTLNVTMASAHRLFDKRWLTSPYSKYELVGIIHRPDRAAFAPEHCGELRFIYRLAYKTAPPKARYSRLPMTVNAVFYLKREGGTCSANAKKWQRIQDLPRAGAVASLRKGLGIDDLKSIEVNLQIVRWPSTVRPDFGGYAEYLLRAFKVQNNALVALPLENTPDVEKVLRTPELKAELLAWLKTPENLKRVDRGVAVLPEKFLATKAISVALQGPHRLANAPFTRIFSDSELAGVDVSNTRMIKSRHGLLRRLNDLSCVGCHQGRTVAGFHFLGRDRIGTIAVNSIAVSASGHFFSEQGSRAEILNTFLSGKAESEVRDFSVRSRNEKGTAGAHCGLGDPAFASWTCASGFSCVRTIVDDRVSRTGICQPRASVAGSACRVAKITHASDPLKDKMAKVASIECRSGQFCEEVAPGFPSGMCSGGCRGLKPGEICGKIAILQPFNDCLGRGAKPFDSCLSENVRPGALQECGEARLCRDDYICASVDGGKGACIPPYFLFQLRLDGHPKPI